MTSTSLKTLDEQKINRFHWRMVFTAGMGFFTDAYDLFIIGIVTTILTPIWHLTTSQLAILNGASLISAACGAIFFGVLADKLGRKKMYGVEMMILFIGAIASALAPFFFCLLLARIFVGFGIGGDYPTSAVVASEYSNRKNRGFLVLLVFAMQALGLIMGPLIASLFISLHLPNTLVWRLLLGLGAIPAASVFYLRRRITETPRFLEIQKYRKKLHNEVSRVVSDLTGLTNETPISSTQLSKQHVFSKRWFKYFLGTAGAWFLLDVAFYGNGISSMLIMNHLKPHASLLIHTLFSAGIFLCFAAPGYIFSALFVDVIGRKRLQSAGFIIMAACYAGLACIPTISLHPNLFLALFGLSFFFVNFGPNATTFLIPSEIFPTTIRAQAHGLSAAVGKLGAFVGAYFLPMVLHAYGMSFTMQLTAFIALGGAALTTLLPEMRHVSLEYTDQFAKHAA